MLESLRELLVARFLARATQGHFHARMGRLELLELGTLGLSRETENLDARIWYTFSTQLTSQREVYGECEAQGQGQGQGQGQRQRVEWNRIPCGT